MSYPLVEQPLDERVDDRAREERFVALDVHDDVGVGPGRRRPTRGRSPRAAPAAVMTAVPPASRTAARDALVVGGDEHVVDTASLLRRSASRGRPSALPRSARAASPGSARSRSEPG